MPRTATGLSLVLVLLATSALPAADWPTGRFDANRSAASPEALPARLQLQWSRDFPAALEPAWPDQPKLQSDAAYEPIVVGKTMVVGSSRTDSVVAFDTETGEEKWRFLADGPIRYAPAAANGKLYVVADDGYLYCLDAGAGKLLWKFRGGPSDRRILGNERLISTWPARGAPVIADGTVYFAASIWPFMGIFIHALDAETGKVVWTNDGDGAVYMKQPHGADSFAAVAPQGPMVVAGNFLLIPSGRSVPAVYDRKTGKMVRYTLADNGKRGGGTEVSAIGGIFFNGGAAFEIATEKYLADFGRHVVLTNDVVYTVQGSDCKAYDWKTAGMKTTVAPDRKGTMVKTTKWSMVDLGSCKVPPVESLIKAGHRLYAGAKDQVFAIEFPTQPVQSPGVTWKMPVEGTVLRLLAADGKLFAVTQEGRIYCFGDPAGPPRVHRLPPAPETFTDGWTDKARKLLDTTGVREGWCVAWGVGSGRLATELARQSKLHVIVVDPDEKKVQAFRTQLAAAGIYGDRVAAHAGDPLTFPLPPYLASLMVAEELPDAGPDFLKKAFGSLRPYGGVACLPLPGDKCKEIEKAVADANLVNGKVKEVDGFVMLVREGALPGSANWTHEHADAANTRVSADQIVKAPLGILWFGGASNDGILPRHGHGPQPQVVNGRLIIEGVDLVRAMDIYTGRVLWETKLPGVGGFFNNLSHQPGANSSGTNFISTADGIYVAYADRCIRLDPATGKKTAEFLLPIPKGQKEPPRWGYINIVGDYLVGGSDPIFDAANFKPTLDPKLGADPTPGEKADPPKTDPLNKVIQAIKAPSDNMSSSRELVVMDRHTGKVLWTATSQLGFRHNATCAGGGRLYAIDRLSGAQLDRLKRRGEEPPHKARLLVFDLKTGKELWNTQEDVFGTWLSYSAKHDVIVEAGRVASDSLSDEAKGMRAYQADAGKVLWTNKSYLGPAMIHGDTILKNLGACDLLTGKPTMRLDTMTGQLVEWKWFRNYGCNTPMASEHLMTFRSGAAGYYDLCNDGGTGNFGGFRSSCTNNLVVAGGVLTAPDYTRTCTCQYQNQTSLGLVPMADVEMWTSFGPLQAKGAVRQVGINLGAPGDRRAADGNLWLEYPSVGGASPNLNIRTTGEKLEWFRRHSSQVQGDPSWIGASGVKGLTSISVGLMAVPNQPTVWHWIGQAFGPAPFGPVWLAGVPKLGETKPDSKDIPDRLYTIRLYFNEPDNVKPGQRKFNVFLQGQQVLSDFDVVRAAGGPNRVVVKEFKGIAAARELTVTLKAVSGTSLLSAIEVRAEGW